MNKKIMKKLLFLLFLVLLNLSLFGQRNVNIIPYPNKVQLLGGQLDASGGLSVSGNSKEKAYLEKLLNDEFQISTGSDSGSKLKLRLTKPGKADSEAYSLKIVKNQIEISGASETAIFYGIQSLRQLLMHSKELPLVRIKDEPRFGWRSYMLDVARNFQSVETVKKILDDMALLKFNRFHWHLTNDQGWRLEIKEYPLLTEIGSKRDSTQINFKGEKWASKKFDGKPQSGFYTREEVKDILKYAKERHIMVIPEISMPGHITAAIASYPFLGVTKQKIKVPTSFGVVTDVLDVSDPRAIQFIHNVLREVSGLFPAPYIHIGGDEVKFDLWKKSPAINAYMKKQGIKDYFDLQVAFTNGISKFVADSLHKNIIGWNEILGISVHDYQKDVANADIGLSKNAIVQFWTGSQDILRYALSHGYHVINSNSSDTYLDYDYKRISLNKAYSFNPVPEGLDKTEADRILGLGTQMWGEWTPGAKEVEYQTYPRIAAYAEDGWTQTINKDYSRFLNNLQPLLDYWKSKGYDIPQPGVFEE